MFRQVSSIFVKVPLVFGPLLALQNSLKGTGLFDFQLWVQEEHLLRGPRVFGSTQRRFKATGNDLVSQLNPLKVILCKDFSDPMHLQSNGMRLKGNDTQAPFLLGVSNVLPSN